MPPKNSIKVYETGAYYHIYNRGVEKRDIFLDDQDYRVFLSSLKKYLSDPLQGDALKSYPSRQLKNFVDEIDLLAYCLMPNHFHFLIKQHTYNAIKDFMISLGTKYTMYFNKKYDRVGKLYQGVYKAVKINSPEQLVHLTKYIHLNPKEKNMYKHKYFSLPNYFGEIVQIWVKPQEILSYFNKGFDGFSYADFISQEHNLEQIKHLLID